MVINLESVRNCSDKLKLLAREMETVNYVVLLSAVFFEFQADEVEAFQVKNLRDVASKFHKNLCAGLCCRSEVPMQAQGESCIVGTLELAEFARSIEDINYSLTFDHPYEADLAGLEKQVRIDFYWNEVGKYFCLPPTRVYKFNDYDPFWVMWGFKYIYINDTNKTGIVLSGGSAD